MVQDKLLLVVVIAAVMYENIIENMGYVTTFDT